MTDPDDDDELTGQLAVMAREAGVTDPDLGAWTTDYGYSKTALIKFAALVAGECAKICDSTTEYGALDLHGETRAYASAAAIRARFGLDGGPK